jgi:hypothetical protein
MDRPITALGAIENDRHSVNLAPVFVLACVLGVELNLWCVG